MALSRIQFDILETMARERKPFSSAEMISTKQKKKEIADALRELDEKGYGVVGELCLSGIQIAQV